ncbi:unnamed protein product [Caenorhabditis brenneri]
MDSDDPIGRKYRKGKRVLKIPVNGSQKFEIKNITKEEVSVDASLYSYRFTILNTRRKYNSHDGNVFNAKLPPNNSFIFEIKDNGHVDMDKLPSTCTFEGILMVEVKKITQTFLLNTDPETESYRKLRSATDQIADCDFQFRDGNIGKFVSIEPISDNKYGKTLPNNVKTLESNADDDERYKKENEVFDQLAALNRDLTPSEEQRLFELVFGEYEEDLKAQKKTIQSQYISPALQSKRSVTSEKSDTKSLSRDPLTSVTQSKKSEKSEEKSMSKNPKSTLKSEKTTKSEMVQKSEKVDVSELKNEKKKKRKKKKRCVIC